MSVLTWVVKFVPVGVDEADTDEVRTAGAED
jgi:hypothetical protein